MRTSWFLIFMRFLTRVYQRNRQYEGDRRTKYTIEKMPNEPVIVMKVHEDYNPPQHMGEGAKALNRILDKSGGPVFFIQDLTRMKVDFEDIVVGAATIGRGNTAPFHHPNIRENIAVTQDPIIRMAIEGMATDVYGNVHVIIFDTLDEAMDYVHNTGTR